MIGYLFLCFITIFAGRGILRLIRVLIDFGSALFLAPVLTLAFWSIFLGWGVLFGFPVKQLWIVGWSVTLLLALYGVKCSKEQLLHAKWILLIGVVVIPIGLMAPYFWHGIQTYPGSWFWDGWAYVAFGQYLMEYPLGTEGGMAPLFQYASKLSHTRFVSSAMLAFFAPMTGALQDAQAATGYFLAWTIYVFSSACTYFIITLDKIKKTWLRFAYVAFTVFSGWVLNVLMANNYDNALVLSFLPAFGAIIYSFKPKNWRWAVILGALAAAAFFCFPEMSPALFLGVSLFLLQRIFSENGMGKSFLKIIAISAVIFTIIIIPYLNFFFPFMKGQIHAALGQNAQRPGEGYFPQLLSARCFLTAFWGFVTPFQGCIRSVLQMREFIQIALAISFSALAIIGIASFFQRKLWGMGLFVLILLCGTAVMIFRFGYDYGAYKFILLNWWGICFSVFSGASAILVFFRSARYRWMIYLSFFVLFATYVGIIRKSIITCDKHFVPVKDSMILRQAGDIKSFIGENSVIVSINDDYCNLWTVYYLRNMNIHLMDYHVYMADPNLDLLMSRSKWVDLSNARYVLTDNQKIMAAGSLEVIWRSELYHLLKLPTENWMIFGVPINPNGLEVWNGEQAFWMGQGETRLQLISSYNGQAFLKGIFFPGPSLPEKAGRDFLLSTDRGYQKKITIEKEGLQVYAIPIVTGINWVTMKPLDKPSIHILPNHDTRPLLIGVRGLSVMNEES